MTLRANLDSREGHADRWKELYEDLEAKRDAKDKELQQLRGEYEYKEKECASLWESYREEQARGDQLGHTIDEHDEMMRGEE